MEVAVLTKSSKFGNYCVAGINLASGEFVRLVTEDDTIHGALTLIRVSDFVVHQRVNAGGRPKASFNYNGYIYDDMSITDPDYYNAENGTEVDDAILVVSIGSPYGDKHYKFVSAVYEI
ncbi:MAG: hypothetical protein RR071_10690 [Lachnospiraceae bacterium]